MSKKLKNIIAKTAGMILCALISLIILVPLYWLIATSFKSEADIYTLPLQLFPLRPTSANYQYALTQSKIPVYFLNSILYVAVTVALVLLISSLAAYSISRFKHRGKKGFLFGVLLSQYMPVTTLVVPLYMAFNALDAINNRLALIGVYCALQIPIAIWLLIGYFNGIPKTLDEAATIDGCTTLQSFFKVVLPLAKPGLMAVAISVAIAIWQELILATTFTNVDALRPMMVGVSSAVTKSGIKWGQLSATGVIACIPVVVIYAFCQRYLVKGLTSGAVKG